MAKYSLPDDRKNKYVQDTEPSAGKYDISAIDKFRKLDEHNPVEQAKKYDQVKRNPPKRGYMQVDMYQDKDDRIFSESKGFKGDGKSNRVYHDRFFTVDLNTAIMADVARCPSNTVPMLIDQAQQLVMNEKSTFKPEKRGAEFNWWWIVFGVLMIPGIITAILLISGMFG